MRENSILNRGIKETLTDRKSVPRKAFELSQNNLI